MDGAFQRIFVPDEPASLNAQAALGIPRQPHRSQFSWLLRLFLERFFNHETASPDGDAKTRLVQVACAAALPPFMVALYLDPVYHSATPPPYWLQVNHHLFFVLYSFVAMGIAMVFEWDMFFPDLLDIQILKPLPVKDRNVFLARVSAIALLVAGFLFDSNFLPPVIMHITLNPPNPLQFTIGHIVAVSASGLFSAAFTLAFQGSMLSLLGERIFRSLSLLLQGLIVALLVMSTLLFPSLSAMLPVALRSGSPYALCFPPFWFLGIYQRLIEGPATPPIFTTLAGIGLVATLGAVGLTMLTYPFAYSRRVRHVIEGAGKQTILSHFTNPLTQGLTALFDRVVLTSSMRRAVFRFVSQTLFRLQRYRIYLALYCGVGLSVVLSTIFRFTVSHQQVFIEIVPDGVRAAVAIVAFWTIAGLRVAFVSAGNRNGSWVFNVSLGRPPAMSTSIDLAASAQTWVVTSSSIITLGTLFLLHLVAPPSLRTFAAIAAQSMVAVGLCVLLTDLFFLNVTTIPFTGERPRDPSNLAFTVLKYIALFPFVSALPVGLEPWIERSPRHFLIVFCATLVAHALFRRHHRGILRDFTNQPALEDDEEDFPLKLGLRY